MPRMLIATRIVDSVHKYRFSAVSRHTTEPPLWLAIHVRYPIIYGRGAVQGPAACSSAEPQTHVISYSLSPVTSTVAGVYRIPIEWWQADYDAIADATANGTLVVAAAGNGSTTLDDPVYNDLFDRTVRSSGAILVAVSLSTSRSPTCFTNWGSRIDMHSWGENIVTLGYGTHPDFDSGDVGGDEDRFYTATFGGTSGATPIVTGSGRECPGGSPPKTKRVMAVLREGRAASESGAPFSQRRRIGVSATPVIAAAPGFRVTDMADRHGRHLNSLAMSSTPSLT